MGSRSKCMSAGAFGSRAFVVANERQQVMVEKIVTRKGKPVTVQEIAVKEIPHIVHVVRPNRGRRLWNNRRLARRGFRGLKMGELGKKVKVVRQEVSTSVTAKKRNIFGRMFQRKGE